MAECILAAGMSAVCHFGLEKNMPVTQTMNKYFLFLLICLLTACQSAPEIIEGRWSGHLSPMNHPEMENPVIYEVAYVDDHLTISILGPDGALIPTQNPRLESDTLYFSFEEPEEQVQLNCALAKNERGEFSGKCLDRDGKWAHFTMVPPA
jgi:hypothetical protein